MAATPVCDASTSACRACQAHSECASGICKASGSCADAATEIYFVDSRSAATVGACQAAHASADGSKANAFCDIATATGAATKRPYVVVAGSSAQYGPVSFTTPQTETIIGPGPAASPPAVIYGGLSNSVTVTPGATNNILLTIEGMTIGSSTTPTTGNGIACTQNTGTTANITLRNSVIQKQGLVGFLSSGCTITVDADVISSNQGAGIRVATTTYTITNNIIAGNGAVGTPGVRIDDSPAGSAFAFNTVTTNGGAGNTAAGGITCNAAATITDSIIVANNLSSPTGTQLTGSCTLANVVVGADSTSDAGAIKNMPPSFVSGTDFHLKLNDASNTACCVDKVTTSPATPNSDHDVDLSKRKKGLGWDYGAHEVQ